MTAVFATVVAQSRKLVHADRATLFQRMKKTRNCFRASQRAARRSVSRSVQASAVAQTGETINIVDAQRSAVQSCL